MAADYSGLEARGYWGFPGAERDYAAMNEREEWMALADAGEVPSLYAVDLDPDGTMSDWRRIRPEEAEDMESRGFYVSDRPLTLNKETRAAIASEQVKDAYLATDPLTGELQTRALDTVKDIDPGVYEGYGKEIAADKADYEAQAADLRKRYMGEGGLSSLHKWATGADSLVARRADIERDNITNATASNIASARGGYSPALARAGLMSQNDALAQLGAETALAKSQEQRAAVDQYMRGISIRDATDQTQSAYGTDLVRQQAAMSAMGNA